MLGAIFAALADALKYLSFEQGRLWILQLEQQGICFFREERVCRDQYPVPSRQASRVGRLSGQI